VVRRSFAPFPREDSLHAPACRYRRSRSDCFARVLIRRGCSQNFEV
jgi:hypothetical protein